MRMWSGTVCQWIAHNSSNYRVQMIGYSIVKSMKENFFLFVILVVAFKPLLSSIVDGVEEGFTFGNEALGT